LDKRLVERWVKDVLATPADKIMHNAAYDLGWLRASGFQVNGTIYDTMLAAPVLDENRYNYSLNALGFDYLKETKSEQGLKEAASDFGVHPKKELWKLPAMHVGGYAEQDAALTLKLWHHLRALMRKDEVESIFELETDVLPVLVDITLKGINFDRAKCEKNLIEMRQKEAEILKYLKSQAGMTVDIWAAQSIATAFDRIGIQYPKTAAGAPSFTKSFLDTHEHPMAKMILEAREYQKTHGTFLEPYLKHSAKDGRLHTHFNQMRNEDGGAVTGRLSAANPNLQQVPARHPVIGPMVRSLFLPEEGQEWAANDFSSQEPRILIHYASLLGLPGADKVVDAYRNDPATDFYQIVANAAGIPRKMAKTCIAEGQPVLTDKGLVPIEQVTMGHKVWDGVEWVDHDGVAFMGIKEVITYGSLTATPDHDVWTVESGKIPFGLAASRLDALVSTGDVEQAIRYVDSRESRGSAAWQASIRQSAVRLWGRGLETVGQLKKWKIHHVPTMHYATATFGDGKSFVRFPRDRENGEKGLRDFSTLHKSKGPCLQGLRWKGDHMRVQVSKGPCGLPSTDCSSREVDGEDHRQGRQQLGVPGGKHTIGDVSGEQHEPKKLKKVYDILNAGPRHRFTVSGVLVSNCSLGMMYGMGKAKLAQQLDLPVDEASDLINTFHSKVPFLKGTVDAVMKRIEHPASNGSIRTLLGRRCRFPLWEPVEWGVNKALPREQAVIEYGARIKRAGTYKGLNRLIQGSAADQTKAGLVALHKAGFNLLLQVHDEIALSVRSRDEAREAADIMARAVTLEVPSRVDVEVGPSWGEAA
jgi:DNA polymerase I-like protein with 3'-5' exonuclease and polymerase domains